MLFAYTFGIVMALLLGTGMCLSMGIIGGQGTLFMTMGIIIGIIGIAGISVNFPIYRKILDHSKNKYSADIIALADQIAEE